HWSESLPNTDSAHSRSNAPIGLRQRHKRAKCRTANDGPVRPHKRNNDMFASRDFPRLDSRARYAIDLGAARLKRERQVAPTATDQPPSILLTLTTLMHQRKTGSRNR